ncbi:hypothetical protein RchiOBHm_Chr1g0371011 [Rosa chinensis]|uniref:Uncharacterized protein n=1 Tax=Rosa chinensis TaxID=74649 RepID=A0A2P6SLG9_ROSCH|nr:hypothetical protein RchiOBHm_Chr1g0371011 [Rosa chinensis]
MQLVCSLPLKYRFEFDVGIMNYQESLYCNLYNYVCCIINFFFFHNPCYVH